MKKIVLIVLILVMLALVGLRFWFARPADGAAPVEQPQAAASADIPQTAPSAAVETPAVSRRQVGERFESVYVFQGFAQTVHYEHIRNDSVGVEMDYNFESFTRISEPGLERFVSVWDDPKHIENYLEVTYRPEDAETAAAAISEELSAEYEILRMPVTLENAGSCIQIGASEVKGGGYMPEHLQMVYIIPAPDGCRVAWEHSYITESEAMGKHFSDFVNTIFVTERNAQTGLTDEQALAAIRQYCYRSNPELEGIVNAGEYPVYWEIANSDAQQVVVLFRSYTGSLNRYYIDRATGEAYVTEFVPGITEAEQETGERLNVRDYLN